MGLTGEPKMILDGLVLYYDIYNEDSYPGMPCININRPLTNWHLNSRIQITELTGSANDSPVIGARTYKIQHTGSIAANSLTREGGPAYTATNPNTLILSGSMGVGYYKFSMWVKGDPSNPSNASLQMDCADKNIKSVSLTGSQWIKLESDDSLGKNNSSYEFFDIELYPYGGVLVTAYVSAIMITRVSGSSIGNLYKFNSHPQFLPDGASRSHINGLKDLSGNNYNANLTNVTYDSSSNIYFSSSQYIDCGAMNELDSGNVTIDVWTNNIQNAGVVIGKHYNNFEMRIEDIYFGGYLGVDGGWREVNDAAVAHGTDRTRINNYTWVINLTDNKMYMYSNGQYKGVWNGGTIGHYNISQNMYLGTRESYSGFLSGSVLMVKCYNRALSTAEVLQNYNSVKGRFNL